MVLRPEDIEQREFGSALRGFDKAEVRAFLRRVAGEVRYMESEIEASRQQGTLPLSGDDSIETADRAEPVERDSRPAPPVAIPTIDDAGAVEDRLPDLGAPGSELPGIEFQSEPDVEFDAPAPLTSRIEAVAPEPRSVENPEVEADRFAALGDRIASLLRNAQETADQVRQQADVDALQVRSEAATAAEELRMSADAYSTEVREAANADATSNRRVAEELLDAAQSEAAEIREHALADANEMRTAAATELDTARSEVPQIRQRAIDDGRATLTSREADIAQRETQVNAERAQALAELADARSQVSVLLQEARAQSEFIRQESEEIIRTKVRANMEQAQRRIDMLRTTETASKDRIAAARKELENAMARLDAEPAPSLPPGTEELVLDEARQAADEAESFPLLSDPGTKGRMSQAPIDEIDFETLGAESETSQFETDDIDSSGVVTGDIDAGGIEVESRPDTEVGLDADDVIEASIIDAPETSGAVFESESDPNVQGGSFFAPRTDAGVAPPPPPGFEHPVGVDAPVFQTPEPPQVPDPLEGLVPPDAPDTDPGYTFPEFADPDYHAEAGADQVVFGQRHPADEVSEIDTPENEDALAKLVREAMQRAVDSARGKEA